VYFVLGKYLLVRRGSEGTYRINVLRWHVRCMVLVGSTLHRFGRAGRRRRGGGGGGGGGRSMVCDCVVVAVRGVVLGAGPVLGAGVSLLNGFQ
jgi:hypothetical protein